jgi:hypothetical protein
MFELWHGEDVDPANAYASGYRVNGEGSFEPEEAKAAADEFRSNHPGARFVVDDWFSAGDRYVLRMHVGSRRGIEVFEVRDDRIVDVWLAWDGGDPDAEASEK